MDNTKNQPRPLFEDNQNLNGPQFDEFRTKLHWAVNHVIRYRNQLGAISAPLKDAVKHHQKLAEAIAESIKFKSTLPMAQAFGPHWEKEVQDLQALYSSHDDRIKGAQEHLAKALDK